MKWQGLQSCKTSLDVGRLTDTVRASAIARCACSLATKDLRQQSMHKCVACHSACVHVVRVALGRAWSHSQPASLLRFVFRRLANAQSTVHLLCTHCVNAYGASVPSPFWLKVHHRLMRRRKPRSNMRIAFSPGLHSDCRAVEK